MRIRKRSVKRIIICVIVLALFMCDIPSGFYSAVARKSDEEIALQQLLDTLLAYQEAYADDGCDDECDHHTDEWYEEEGEDTGSFVNPALAKRLQDGFSGLDTGDLELSGALKLRPGEGDASVQRIIDPIIRPVPIDPTPTPKPTKTPTPRPTKTPTPVVINQ